METAKVDVRRLQVLNDRINQMLEVLQQMRLSMHALQHVPDERALFAGGVTPFPGYGYGSFNPFVPTQYLQGGLPYGTSPYSMPIPQPWAAPIYSRPYWTGYEGEVSARFADPRFVDARFAPGVPQIPFTQNVPLPFTTQNGQIPFTANGQVPFSHSPTAAFG